MANEIQVTAKLVDSAFDVDRQPGTFSVDRAGDAVLQFIQEVGITNEALLTNTDIGTVGWAYFENLDSTNFVQIGPTDSVNYVLKLLAGEKCVCPLATATLYAKADTAAVDLAVTIIER